MNAEDWYRLASDAFGRLLQAATFALALRIYLESRKKKTAPKKPTQQKRKR